MDILAQSISTAATLYINDCFARAQSKRTIEGKRSSVGLFEKWCLSQGVTTFGDIDNNVLEDYREYLSQYRSIHSSQLLQRSTQRNRLTAVVVFVRRLFKRFKIPNCPSDDFELPKPAKRLPNGILSDDEVQRIFYQVQCFGHYKLRDRAILEVYWATSMRREELANLRLSDVITNEKVVRINHGKNDKDRVVPISDRACRVVKDYVEQQRSELATFNSDDTLFLNNQGKRFEGRQLSALFNFYKRRAGVKKRGACNLFRHTGATRMLERGADIRVIQELLGHADLSTTQIYTHVAVNTLKRVYKETHPSNFV